MGNVKVHFKPFSKKANIFGSRELFERPGVSVAIYLWSIVFVVATEVREMRLGVFIISQDDERLLCRVCKLQPLFHQVSQYGLCNERASFQH